MSIKQPVVPEWTYWHSILSSPYESMRVEHEIANGYYLYSAFVETPRGKYLANGVLNKEKMITGPIFTPYFRLVDGKRNLAIFDLYISSLNKTVLMNFTNGKILTEGFAAYRYKDGQFCYRIDSKDNGMKWYSFDIDTHDAAFIGASLN